MFLFMQEDIENVSFVGFVDAEMQVFRTALEETDENDAEKKVIHSMISDIYLARNRSIMRISAAL